MSQSPERSGAIYDIGYRSYLGPRLGRRAAFESLYFQGIRAAFGLGRRPASKVAPWALTALALIPAAVYLGIASLAPADLDIIRTEDYLQVIVTILILFVAAVGPEVAGRDLRFRTLSLYFTRPLERDDYAIARLASLTTATLAITLVPQTILIIGNALAASNAWEYVREEWAEVPRVAVSGVISALYVSSLGLAISSHTHRRSVAMGGVVAAYFVFSLVGNILAELLGGAWLLIDPDSQLRAVTLLVFGRDANNNEPLGEYDVPLAAGAFVLFGVLAAMILVIVRRYRSVSA